MLAILVTLALADDGTCVACCKAGGLDGCPTQLHVRTEKSGTEAGGLTWDLQGAWTLSCDGTGRFDPTYATSLDHEPEYGEVLGSGSNPLAVHCFVEACALPQGVCVGKANLNGDVQLVGCDDTLPVDQRDLARAPTHVANAGAMVVVIDGRPIVAEKADGEGSSPAPVASPPVDAGASPWGAAPVASPGYSPPQTPAAAPVYAPPAATASTGYPPPPAWEPAPGSQASAAPAYPSPAPAYTPPAPAYTPPAPAYTPPAPSPAADAPLVLELPPDPPDPCAPAPDAVRSESRKRVGTGDDYRIANHPADALKDYRAALTMDKCNGYAWMSIAQVANDQGRPDLAIRALRNTTRLLPAHPGGWLMLGKAYEAIGQRTMAAEAFKKAAEIAPGNAEAVEGYMRTRG